MMYHEYFDSLAFAVHLHICHSSCSFQQTATAKICSSAWTNIFPQFKVKAAKSFPLMHQIISISKYQSSKVQIAAAKWNVLKIANSNTKSKCKTNASKWNGLLVTGKSFCILFEIKCGGKSERVKQGGRIISSPLLYWRHCHKALWQPSQVRTTSEWDRGMN